jgi:hypothetical protein
MGVWELGRWSVVASDQPCPVADALFEMALELQENGGMLSGGRGPATFAHHAAGQANAGGAVQPPVMPFNPSSFGRPHRDLPEKQRVGSACQQRVGEGNGDTNRDMFQVPPPAGGLPWRAAEVTAHQVQPQHSSRWSPTRRGRRQAGWRWGGARAWSGIAQACDPARARP